MYAGGKGLNGIVKGYSICDSLQLGCKAAAITITRKGAGESIPNFDEVK